MKPPIATPPPEPSRPPSTVTSTPCRLLVRSGESRDAVFPLKGHVVTVGRGPENAIQIIDTRASRRHFTLEQRDGDWFISDLQSKNGTWVNDTSVAAPVRLNSGDLIRFGETVLLFENEFAHTTSHDARGEHTGVTLTPGDSGLESSHFVELASQHPAGLSAFESSLDIIPADPAESFTGDLLDPARRRLQSLYQVAQVIQSILDLDALLEKVMEIVAGVLKPTHAAILLHDEKLGRLVPHAVRRPSGESGEILISSSILDTALRRRAGVLLKDPLSDGRFAASESIARNHIRSAVCVPLISRDRVFGALYLDSRHDADPFTQGDLEWVVGVATQAALGIDSAYHHAAAIKKRESERELEIAREIQMNLLPRAMPRLRGFDFGGFSEPAHMVGGDYYDIAVLPDGSLALTVADVSGKGIPAAILVASVRAAVRMEARSLPRDGVIEVMQRLNEIVYEETMTHMFITMVLAHLDPSTRQLIVANAGHNPPLIRMPDGKIVSVEAGGCFLGIEPGQFFERTTLELPSGATALLFTDGITDAMNDRGERFGTQRLTDFLHKHHTLPAAQFCERLNVALESFRGTAEPFDDMTALVLKSL